MNLRWPPKTYQKSYLKSYLKTLACSILVLQLSNLPAASAGNAEAVSSLNSTSEMISTLSVVSELDRSEMEQKLTNYISQEQVQKALLTQGLSQGLSPNEIATRLASLSEVELRQLSGQIDQARAGGDILVTVLLVVLIIFLIKKM